MVQENESVARFEEFEKTLLINRVRLLVVRLAVWVEANSRHVVAHKGIETGSVLDAEEGLGRGLSHVGPVHTFQTVEEREQGPSAGVAAERGLPRSIRVDNGPEFTSKHLDQWAYLNGVELDFIRPGKPTENALIESFNGRLRQECLNENWFLSLNDAREKIESWRQDYNHDRPHRALKGLAPTQFARSLQVQHVAG